MFNSVNSVTLILLGSAVCLLPFGLGLFYYRRFSEWENETFENRYGAFLEGLKKDKKSSLAYPVMFVSNRIFFSVIAIILSEYFFA